MTDVTDSSMPPPEFGPGTEATARLHRPVDLGEVLLRAARRVTDGPDGGDITLHLGAVSRDVFAHPADLERLIVALAVHVRSPFAPRACVRVRIYDMPPNEERPIGDIRHCPGRHLVVELTSGTADAVTTIPRLCEEGERLRRAGLGWDLLLVLERHGAAVELLEAPLQRTARLLLPVGDSGALAVPSRVMTVLLVDDDAALRTATAHALREQGCMILSACDGEDALDVYRACHPQIDAVILDVQMPRLGGLDCLPALHDIDPAPGVILVSGAKLPTELRRTVQAGAASFLGKPYEMDALASMLASVAAGRGRRGEVTTRIP
jgi:CheY-like chemotaxis protein